MNYPIIVSLDQRCFDKEKHLFLEGSPVVESLTKNDRPYVEGTLVADEINTYFVPFRSHVDQNFAKKHSEAVVTLRTKSKPDAGLDIRKMLVVGNDTKLKVRKHFINKEQYRMLIQKQDELWNKVEKYVSEYQREVRVGEKLRPEYKYTTLQNFHKELGLEKMEQQTERKLDLENLKQLQEDGYFEKLDVTATMNEHLLTDKKDLERLDIPVEREKRDLKEIADQLPKWREVAETDASARINLAKYGRNKDLDKVVAYMASPDDWTSDDDEEIETRESLAMRGRDKDLDKLVFDKDEHVRRAVVREGRDKDLDKLVSDREAGVRMAVAGQGRDQDLDKLVGDKDPDVREAAEEAREQNQRKNSNLEKRRRKVARRGLER